MRLSIKERCLMLSKSLRRSHSKLMTRLRGLISTHHPTSLTKSDIAQMLGITEGELDDVEDKIRKSHQKKQDFINFLDLAKRGNLSPDQMKAYRLMEKNYANTGSLTESMIEAMDLFREHFAAGQITLMEKAIKALDLSAFLTILSTGMAKAF